LKLFVPPALALFVLFAAVAAPSGPIRRSSRAVKGSYIVVLADQVGSRSGEDAVAEIAAALVDLPGRGHTTQVFEHALRAFSMSATEEEAADLAEDGRVAWVEEDAVVEAASTRPSASWGIDRIDQRDLPLSGTFTSGLSGAGVHVYVLDTGLRASHRQLTGRIGTGYSAMDDGRGTSDCSGHGTHVAGIIAGATYGVASGATIHPVRVLDCQARGTVSAAIRGVEWVTRHHQRPAIANISLASDEPSAALDAAVARAIAAGVTFVVAAGNKSRDACGSSPARVPGAITVGASTRDDERADFSNHGPCLDVFAPGKSITSAWATSDTASSILDGTSMAGPHVTGTAALYLEAHPQATPAEVAAAVLAAATPGRVLEPDTDSPNRLLYSSLPDLGSSIPRSWSRRPR
jgi:serine protease